MMRMFKVRVKTYKGEDLFVYTAITKPVVNEIIRYDDGRYLVSLVTHLLKSWTDGNGKTVTLDEIVVEVANC